LDDPGAPQKNFKPILAKSNTFPWSCLEHRFHNSIFFQYHIEKVLKNVLKSIEKSIEKSMKKY